MARPRTCDKGVMAQEFIRPESRRRLVRLCTALSRDATVAEDLAQETLVEAWRHRDRLVEPDGVDRWLAAIARNVCRRWSRDRSHAVEPLDDDVDVAGADDLELELEREELVALLDRALALLPDETRRVLIERYVNESSRAQIAASFGVSVDAVSMRLNRGKLVLRRVLARELRDEADAFGIARDGWATTQVWCSECGRAHLEMRRTPERVSFRCRTCSSTLPASEVSLRSPFFSALIGSLVRPSAIVARNEAAVHRFFAAGAGAVSACPGCGADVPLAVIERDVGKRLRGLFARCGSCGEQMWASAAGLAAGHPRVRAFRRGRRVRAIPHRETTFDGARVMRVRYEDVAGTSHVDVFMAPATLRVLDAV